MGVRTSQISLAVVCMLFGIALMMQLRTQNRLQQAASGESSTDLASIAGDLYDNNTTLRQEVDKLQSQQAAYQKYADPNKSAEIRQEVLQLQAFNGLVPVKGPGIELTIDAPLRPVDVEDMLNEVRNAGAEAIAIGGQRVIYNSAVGGTTGHVTVNGVSIASPVVFDAIGTADVLDRALDRKGGMLSYLRTEYPGAQLVLSEHDTLILPAYSAGAPPKPSG